MKIIEENKIGLESPASLPDISTILSRNYFFILLFLD